MILTVRRRLSIRNFCNQLIKANYCSLWYKLSGEVNRRCYNDESLDGWLRCRRWFEPYIFTYFLIGSVNYN